jgi:GntR family transcriptional regulator
VVEPYAPIPAFVQVAEDLRRQITSGTFGPGENLPSLAELAHRYGVGRHTVRQALQLLRTEGLVDSSRGALARVREPGTPTAVKVPRGGVVRMRMPTMAERAELRIPEGVPVGVLTVAGVVRGVYPGDRFEFVG